MVVPINALLGQQRSKSNSSTLLGTVTSLSGQQVTVTVDGATTAVTALLPGHLKVTGTARASVKVGDHVLLQRQNRTLYVIGVY